MNDSPDAIVGNKADLKQREAKPAKAVAMKSKLFYTASKVSRSLQRNEQAR